MFSRAILLEFSFPVAHFLLNYSHSAFQKEHLMLPNRPRKRHFIPSRSTALLQSLEPRRLLTALTINDTPAVDTITLGVTPTGGIKVILNAVETDYKTSQFDSVIVNSTTANDTINVQATVLPTTVHYSSAANVNVGDASGMQDIQAALNANGVAGGPAADGTAVITLNDTGDSTARTILMTTSGDRESITGLAPAEISIGVVNHPLAAAAPGASISQDSLILTTGAANDAVTIQGLRAGLGITLLNAGGNDAINIGNGSLAQIYSGISIWGRPALSQQSDQSSLTLDDSTDAQPAQFTLSALFPPGPGALLDIDFQGSALAAQRISARIVEINSLTIDGGSGGNAFTVQALPARASDDGPTVTLNTGAGNDKVTLNTTPADTLVNVNGQSGDDAFTAGPLGPFAPSGINGNLKFDGGAGDDTLKILGPQANGLDIPTVPVILTVGLAQHRDLTIRFTDITKLQIENGNYEIDNDLGHISLFVASEASNISFESSTAVTINATQNLTALDISASPVTLADGGAIVLNTNSLHITGGSLDLADDSLQVHYAGSVTPFSTIRASIFAHQILTGNADSRHNLGYADSADGIVATLPASTVLVTYALYGDANLDRTVGFADLVTLAQHYGQSGNANWVQGDFNYDSAVGFADLVLLAQNYGSSFPMTAAIASAAPTPAAALVAPTPVPRPVVSKPIIAPRRPIRR
jgi:hypothetical protein